MNTRSCFLLFNNEQNQNKKTVCKFLHRRHTTHQNTITNVGSTTSHPPSLHIASRWCLKVKVRRAKKCGQAGAARRSPSNVSTFSCAPVWPTALPGPAPSTLACYRLAGLLVSRQEKFQSFVTLCGPNYQSILASDKQILYCRT